MAPRPDRPAPPPVVQRVRLRYAKRGRLRFTSHRDFARAFERALRRANLPMAYSAGFTPHPKVSYLGATPTGVASEAEYLEIGLAAPADLEDLRAALDAALPPGLDVLAAALAETGSLADLVDVSVWEIRLPGVSSERAEGALATFLRAGTVSVERLTKTGSRTLDARAAVVSGRVEGGVTGATECPCAILSLVVRHVTPAVRPDDVLAGLRRVADLVPPEPPEARRLAQGLLDDVGRVVEPLASGRGQTAIVAPSSVSDGTGATVPGLTGTTTTMGS